MQLNELYNLLSLAALAASPASGFELELCGSQYYFKDSYTCYEDSKLCPIDKKSNIVYKSCGEACYDPAIYDCKGDTLLLINEAALNSDSNCATIQPQTDCAATTETKTIVETTSETIFVDETITSTLTTPRTTRTSTTTTTVTITVSNMTSSNSFHYNSTISSPTSTQSSNATQSQSETDISTSESSSIFSSSASEAATSLPSLSSVIITDTTLKTSPVSSSILIDSASFTSEEEANLQPTQNFNAFVQQNQPQPEPLPQSQFKFNNLALNEEFNGNSVDQSIWSFDYGNGDWGWGNGEQQSYVDNYPNVEVSDGKLKLRATNDGSGWKSGKIHTRGKWQRKYGRIEARISLPSQVGAFPAFWMMPSAEGSVWPDSGEIDIIEFLSKWQPFLKTTVHFTWQSYNNGFQAVGDFDATSTDYGFLYNFHVYGVEWTEDSLTFYRDDHIIGSYANTGDYATYPFSNSEFYVILNLAVGPHFGDLPLNNDDMVMEVDYVRWYV